MDYPNNSDKAREEASKRATPETGRINPVVSGNVKAKNKSGIRKLADAVLPDGSENTFSNIWSYILVPAGKDMISDIVGSLLYGDQYRKRRGNVTGVGQKSPTAYRNCYPHPEDSRSLPATRVRSAYEVDEYVITDYRDANEVLVSMDKTLAEYGTVRVADYYEAIRVTPRSSDYKYGWTDLRSARIDKVRDGWIIRFPSPGAV